MPRIDDILEPILADLDACEDHASAIVADGADPKTMAMARICATLRPVLDQANELAAELEVVLAQNARIDPLEARVAELEQQLAEIRKGFAGEGDPQWRETWESKR